MHGRIKNSLILSLNLGFSGPAGVSTQKNVKALYIVTMGKGKEIQKDLTWFAFDEEKNNPGKFKVGLNN